MDSFNHIISIDKMGYATHFNINEYRKLCQDNHITCLNQCINTLTPHYFDVLGSSKYTVVDLASESHVDNSILNPFGIYLENSKLPSSLISSIGMENIEKYVHISTDEVYGDLQLGAKEEGWFTENTPLHPNNPYSASKASQDCFLMSLKHTFGLNLKFIRLANQYGPHQHSEKMLPATVLRAVRGEPIKIYGNGLNARQWTPVVDSVNIIMDVVKGTINEYITHIADKNGVINNLGAVDLWRKILKDNFNISTTVEFIEDRKGHDLLYALKTSAKIDSYFIKDKVERFEESIRFYVENKNNYFRDRIIK